MLIGIRQARLQLGKRDHLRLRGACRTRLSTVSGIAWITVDRDSVDAVVPAGDSFLVPSDRAVLVGPLSGSLTLDVQGADEAKSGPSRMSCGEEACGGEKRLSKQHSWLRPSLMRWLSRPC